MLKEVIWQSGHRNEVINMKLPISEAQGWEDFQEKAFLFGGNYQT